jgi:predicted RNA-binding Zn-ribbon protein involved in translation (DUF1610 family)
VPDLPTRCEVCHSLLDEEDLFCPNCGTEAPKRDQQAGAAADTARTATCNFECAGCGASMSYDAGAGALRCPFCGSVELEKRPDAKILAPRRVVPFALNQDQAVATMRTWLGRGFFRPGDLAREAAVVGMTAVYVPYWVFQATTHTYWTADTSRTPAGARADWYPLSGEHHGSYAGLLVGASGALTPGETSAIGPFDLARGVPPDQVDLDNVVVEQFGVPRKYARPLARQGLEQLEAQTCQQAYVPGRARNVHVNLLVEGLSSEPVLLPVYIMTYRYQDKPYRFLVNGQTGKATGQAPTSLRKILLVVGLVLAAILLAFLLCSGVLGGAMMLGRGDATGGWWLSAAAAAGPLVPSRPVRLAGRDGFALECAPSVGTPASRGDCPRAEEAPG